MTDFVFPKVTQFGSRTGRALPRITLDCERMDLKSISTQMFNNMSEVELADLFADPDCDYHMATALALGHITPDIYSNFELQVLTHKAERLAYITHCGQRDKGGKPYFEHPQRLANLCTKLEDKIVAYLHDTIEDTSVTDVYLMEKGFPGELVEDILLLTHLKGDSYRTYIEKIYASGRVRAINIKLLDLADNMDITRLSEYSMKDINRITKYAASYAYLKTGVWLQDISHV